MRTHFIVKLLILACLSSCNNSDKNERSEVPESTDTTKKEIVFTYLKTDYPQRVFAFKKMPDKTAEEQVLKYEKFSALFIEYIGLYKNQALYAVEDQENNTEAYNVLRDEMVSLKMKLKNNMSSFSKSQENRLDAADAEMNKYLPQVYK